VWASRVSILLIATRTTIINPKVVIEVLSESTEDYDRGAIFSAYRDFYVEFLCRSMC